MLRKYFIQRYKAQFLGMIIPTLVIFLVVGMYVVNFQRQSVREESRNSLKRFEESVDASVYNIGNQIDSLTANASFSLSLKKILDHSTMKIGESTVFSMIKNFFRSYEISYSYIHSIYLYIGGKDRFLTTTTGYVANVSDYFDVDWLQQYLSLPEEEQIFTCRREIRKNSFSDPTPVLTLYYRLTYLDGVIVINIDENEYVKNLMNFMIPDYQMALMYNSRDELVGTAASGRSFENAQMAWSDAPDDVIRPYIRSEDQEKIADHWLRIGGKYYYVCSSHSKYTNMLHVSLCPLRIILDRSAVYIWIAVLILALDAVVILLMAYRSTRSSFRFIEQYIDIFSAAERGEQIEQPAASTEDEYGLILNNIIYMYLRNNRMQMELQDKENQKIRSEMSALQMQINPHFIFNTLQIMDFDVMRELGHDSLVHRMIGQLSKVVKYALTDPMEMVTLRTEIDYLKSYLEIQEVRFSGRGITYFEIDPSVLDLQVFRLMLQPMVENSFEHGMHSDGRNLVIKIKIFDRGDDLSFAVVDNGRGMDREHLLKLRTNLSDPSVRNIGLINLNRRLQLYYGEKSGLMICSRKDVGTVISFRIPKAKLMLSKSGRTENEEN